MPNGDVPDLEKMFAEFQGWDDATKAEVAQRIKEQQDSQWRPFFCRNPMCDGMPHDSWQFNHARSDQRLPPWMQDWLTTLIMSGRGCVAPWTRIDLADGTSERIDVLTEQNRTVQVMTPDGPAWTDGAPFVKGYAHMWTVSLSNGERITVTDQHRFLAPGGWLRLSDVRAGQPLLADGLVQPGAGSAFPTQWREDVLRCQGTGADSRCGCPTCRRSGGLRLPDGSVFDRGDAPSRDGAAGRSPRLSRRGALASTRGCTRAYRRGTRPARTSSSLDAPLLAVSRSRGLASDAVRTPRSMTGALRSPVSTDLRLGALAASQGSAAPSGERLSGLRGLRPSPTGSLTLESPREMQRSTAETRLEGTDLRLVHVEQVTYSHYGPFYDLTVLNRSHAYYSAGVVNHNSGKTRTGSENTHRVAKRVPRIALIGVTNAAVKNVMIEGESGLLRTANPQFQPIWSPSKMQLVWPNGSVAQCYSAEEPDRLRGANNAFAWLDEAAFMPNIDDVWMNLLLTLRVKDPKNPNHILVTTTPTPTEWIKKLAEDPKTVLRRVSTYANKANLSETFWNKITAEFEGTRMGRQELHGEILADVVGALWQSGMIQVLDENETLPAMRRIIVSIDPAGSTDKKADATGVVAVGLGHDNHFYVLDDATDIYSPAEWANKAIELAKKYKADAIVAEKNYGGDMVRYTLESQLGAHQQQFRVILVESRRGKDLRAEPIVGLYEKGLVRHVRGLQKLEAEQLSWVPGIGRSPNRVDALVHGLTELSRRLHGNATFRAPSGIDRQRRDDISEPETPMDRVRRKVPGIRIPGADPRAQGSIMQTKRGRIVVK